MNNGCRNKKTKAQDVHSSEITKIVARRRNTREMTCCCQSVGRTKKDSFRKKRQTLKKAIDRKWPVVRAHLIPQKRNIEVMPVSCKDKELRIQKFKKQEMLAQKII
jgi:hypothetical protein